VSSSPQPPSRALTAEQELQSFSYIVSHDLAASFRHVSEFSRLLVTELSDDLTDRQKDYASHISAASENCQLMMEQLLVYSRIQQRVLTKLDHDASESIQRAIDRFAPRIEAAGAEIKLEPLSQVYGDQDLLDIVFSQLLDNAIKFPRPGVPPRITISAFEDDRTWRLHIADHGLGVDPRYREKAFQMFQRLHGEGAYPGLGAGLTICRRIARRHGGEVRFLDRHEGACVELSLPRSLGKRTLASMQ
jgi:light-regulated signal transduction histidine kinase (bacteriophytochrome)